MPSASPSTLTLPAPAGFDLPTAVCSYGYFLLAPNHWDPDTHRLTRPLRGKRGRLITVTVSQTPSHPERLRLTTDRRADRAEQATIKRQVTRMLRLNEDLSDWWKRCPQAKAAGFGRMFRSPTLFEDMVKTITGCNVTWLNTIRMNTRLVEHVGKGGFPTPRQVAGHGEAALKADAKVGYRADRIVRLARRFVDGSLSPAWFEDPERTSHELFTELKKIHGLGAYAASNLCMLLGYDDRLAIDTETYRHYCRAMNIDRPKDPATLHAAIERHYQSYAPYQFKAYWFELWQDYQRRIGPATTWDREVHGGSFTAANLRD